MVLLQLLFLSPQLDVLRVVGIELPAANLGANEVAARVAGVLEPVRQDQTRGIVVGAVLDRGEKGQYLGPRRSVR